jgi:O-antigen/teichoic acid export membrane protein
MSQLPIDGSPSTGLASILRNLAWILGGKGFGAVCSLIYLAVLSRSLGIKDFGHFSLIFATAQTLVAMTGFQTWQTIVRFGAASALRKDWVHLGRLTGLCAAIDVAGALVGCVLAWLVFHIFAETLDLNPDFVEMGFWFNCALVWARLTTPMGVVRVLDRFDLGSYVEATIPLGRLIASGVIVATGASVGKFLLAWAIFDLFAGALYWLVAYRIAPGALTLANLRQGRSAFADTPGLAGFFGVTYITGLTDAVLKQGPLFAVSWFLGTSAAGIYRLADQLAQGVKQFSALIARAVFPVFALSSQIEGEATQFVRLVRQVTGLGAVAGVIVTLAAIFLGEPLLRLIGGDSFAAGAPVLVPLAMAAAFELASVSYEPMLFSTGHAAAALRVRALALVVLAGGIVVLSSYGPVGMGWAVTVTMAVFYLAMTLTVMRVIRRLPGTGAPAL